MLADHYSFSLQNLIMVSLSAIVYCTLLATIVVVEKKRARLGFHSKTRALTFFHHGVKAIVLLCVIGLVHAVPLLVAGVGYTLFVAFTLAFSLENKEARLLRLISERRSCHSQKEKERLAQGYFPLSHLLAANLWGFFLVGSIGVVLSWLGMGEIVLGFDLLLLGVVILLCNLYLWVVHIRPVQHENRGLTGLHK